MLTVTAWRRVSPAAGCILALVPLVALLGATASQDMTEIIIPVPKARTFLFTYSATFTNLARSKPVKIWLPLPQSSGEQEIGISKQTIPGKHSVGTDPVYGNEILFVEAEPEKDATVAVSLTFKVIRHEVISEGGTLPKPGPKKQIDRFLQADKLVPIGGKPLELLKGEKLGPTPMATGKALFNIVNRHMKYSKEGIGWGNGDAVWACQSKFGNCSDFHSLFISLCRSQKIPAKFEVGFSIPDNPGQGTIGGYHCWAWFLPGDKAWVPVDISEANRFPALRSYYFGNVHDDRVAFTTGRDIDLVPQQSGPALNFFIYPYAEVNGKSLGADQIQRSFSYRNVSGEQ